MLIVMCMCLSLFTACDRNTPVGGDDTTGNTESGSTTEADSYDYDLKLVADGVAEYKLVRPASASKNVIDAAGLIYDAIFNATGVIPDYTDDYVLRGQEPKAEDKEILVGITNRDESKNARADVPYGEYVIKKVGAKLVVFAWDDVSLWSACNKLATYIEGAGSADELTVPKDYYVDGTGFEQIVDLPVYDTNESNTQVVDLADDSYMIYLDRTDKTEFEAYLKKLEDAGYKQFSKREANECVFATYTNDKYIINTTFTAFESNARITFDDKYDMSALEGGEYKKVCEPTVSLVGLETYKTGDDYDYNQSGLFMIFRLEDGRFILVDSGGYDDSMPKVIARKLYEMAVDKNNITVAAWIFTHAHGDHTGGFNKFVESTYAKDITIENFVLNFTTYAQYESMAKADHGQADRTRSNLAKYYPDVNTIKIHTGQVLKFADAEIEMLYTFDDILPGNAEYHNTTTLIFRYVTHDYSVLCLGDSYNVSSDRVVRMYGKYLHSDMVQIAHHGWVGGTTDLYKNISATVNLWPGGVVAFSQTLSERAYNKYALALESVKETYIAGKSVFTFTLPYTPDPSHQNTVIKG